MQPTSRPLAIAALMLAGMPAIVLAGFLLFVLRARWTLGHWPSYNNPDPATLGWWLHSLALQLGMGTFPLFSIAALVLAGIGRARSRAFPVWAVVGVTLGAAALLIAFGRLDPGGSMDWFWD